MTAGAKFPDGSTTTLTKKPDGSTTTVLTKPDGSYDTTTRSLDGKVTSNIHQNADGSGTFSDDKLGLYGGIAGPGPNPLKADTKQVGNTGAGAKLTNDVLGQIEGNDKLKVRERPDSRRGVTAVGQKFQSQIGSTQSQKTAPSTRPIEEGWTREEE